MMMMNLSLLFWLTSVVICFCRCVLCGLAVDESAFIRVGVYILVLCFLINSLIMEPEGSASAKP